MMMRVIEYGTENPEVIMLLHGGGLSWWNFRDEANLLKKKYHVVLPVLDGHAQSNTPFTTIEDNAKEIIGYIDFHFHGTVFAIGGLSLGGQILTEMLSQRADLCQFAIIESALVVPMPQTAAWIAPAVHLCYGLIKKKWFAQLQMRSMKMQKERFEDYYRDTCKIRKQDMIRFLQSNASYGLKSSLSATTADVTLVVGSKEQSVMRRSAEMLHSTIPNSQLLILYDNHGELSLNHPEMYVTLLMAACQAQRPHESLADRLRGDLR